MTRESQDSLGQTTKNTNREEIRHHSISEHEILEKRRKEFLDLLSASELHNKNTFLPRENHVLEECETMQLNIYNVVARWL